MGVAIGLPLFRPRIVNADRHGESSRCQSSHAEQQRSNGRSDEGTRSWQTTKLVFGSEDCRYEDLRKPKAEQAIQEAQRISSKS